MRNRRTRGKIEKHSDFTSGQMARLPIDKLTDNLRVKMRNRIQT